MTTFVGEQKDFSNALYALCELDYDAVEAYKAAINHLESEGYKARLYQFMLDHERQIKDISEALVKHQKLLPQKLDAKQYITQGKIVLASLFGDQAILKAMLTNEVDTNTAYFRVKNHPDKWPEIDMVIEMGLNHEKKHKQWLINATRNTFADA